MEKVFIHGKMEGNMKVNINMIKSMDMEFMHGQMVENMMDNGLMESIFFYDYFRYIFYLKFR
jgi:hypothetical protein